MLHPMPKDTQAHGFSFYQRAQAGGPGEGGREGRAATPKGYLYRRRQKGSVRGKEDGWVCWLSMVPGVGGGDGVCVQLCAAGPATTASARTRSGCMDGKCANKMHRVSCVAWGVGVRRRRE